MPTDNKPIGARASGFLRSFKIGSAEESYIRFDLFDLDSFVNWCGGFGISRGLVLWILYVGLFWVLSLQIPHLALFSLMWLVGTAPVWLPIGLIYCALYVWEWYVRSFYIAGTETVLLEVKIPREISKSPRAMELALTLFSVSSGETTFLMRVWGGGTRPWWSFEMASFGGEIHFYIWTWKAWVNVVESAIYSSYPEVELHQVEDYAAKFKYDPEIHETYAYDWRRETFMGGGITDDSFEINAYPIRTYVDFELDKDPKEEFKVDPLAQTIEFMGTIRPEDQIWAQIVIRKCGWKGFVLKDDQESKWRRMVMKEVEKRRIQSGTLTGDIPISEAEARILRPRATWRMTQQIESMDRNLGKYPFEVGMRGCYITAKKNGLEANYWNSARWMWRAVGNPEYMTMLRPRRWHPIFDYPWQDFHDIRWNIQARRFFDAYRRRLFYHSPWKIPTNIYSNEEIATIWHPVSATVTTPGLERIPAKKSAAPPNLPK